jgi:hypothetical protein
MHNDSSTFQSLDSHISVSDYASSIHPLVVDCRRPKRPSVVYRRRPKTYSSVVYSRRRNSTYENTGKALGRWLNKIRHLPGTATSARTQDSPQLKDHSADHIETFHHWNRKPFVLYARKTLLPLAPLNFQAYTLGLPQSRLWPLD